MERVREQLQCYGAKDLLMSELLKLALTYGKERKNAPSIVCNLLDQGVTVF